MKHPAVLREVIVKFASSKWKKHLPNLWNNSRFRMLVTRCYSLLGNFLLELVPLKVGATESTDLDKTVLSDEISKRVEMLLSAVEEEIEYQLPENTQLQSTEDLQVVLTDMQAKGSVAENFMYMLDTAVLKYPGLQDNMQGLGLLALGDWDPDSKVHAHKWTMESVQIALSTLHQARQRRDNIKQNPVAAEVKEALVQLFNRASLQHAFQELPKWSEIHPRFHTILGTKYHTLSMREYLQICPLQALPVITPQDIAPMLKILPYLHQELRMVGNVMTANVFRSIFKEEIHLSTSGVRGGRGGASAKVGISRQSSQKTLFTIARLDGMVCLLGTAEWAVRQDLLKKLSNFPVALPLIMPTVYNRGIYLFSTKIGLICYLSCIYIYFVTGSHKFEVLLSSLADLRLKWDISGSLHQVRWFRNHFKLITAVRIDENTSKSTVLNALLQPSHAFSSPNEPGARRGIPHALEGSVELIPLTQETCSDTFWQIAKVHYHSSLESMPLFMANLHGNALNFKDHITFLSRISSSFVVFMGPQWEMREQELWNQFGSLIGETSKAFWIMTGIEQPTETLEGGILFNTNDLGNGDSLGILEKYLNIAIEQPPRSSSQWENVSLPASFFMDVPDVRCGADIVSSLENDRDGPLKTRDTLNLQTMYAQEVQASKYPMAMGSQTNMELTHVTVSSNAWNVLMESFLVILFAPYEYSLVILSHLEKELARVSEEKNLVHRSTLRDLQQQIIRLKNTDNVAYVPNLKNREFQLINQIDQGSIGQEQFFRETAQIFNLMNQLDTAPTWLIKKCAKLLTAGQAMEFVEGDNRSFTASWFTAIMAAVEEQCAAEGVDNASLRVYVLSIIGVQSSGKSTLLNALFGCQFAVSVGRCTKGIYVRLLFISEEYRAKLGVDVLVLLDTEGFDAPEKSHLKDSKQKDRLMATFIMGVSDLVIINILGENVNEIKNILEIAIVSLTTLDVAEISPDILITQCAVTERNDQALELARKCFFDALHDTVEFLKQEDKKVEFGITNDEAFQHVRTMLSNPDLLSIRPYKNGATPNAPPSQGYHEDIGILFQHIEKKIQLKPRASVKVLSSWMLTVSSIWTALQQKVLPTSYENLVAMQKFLDMEAKMSCAKQSITEALHSHAKELQKDIEKCVAKAARAQDKAMEFETIQHSLLQSIKTTMESAVTHALCAICSDANQRMDSLKREAKYDGYDTINKFLKESKETLIKTLRQEMEAAIFNADSTMAIQEEINTAVQDLRNSTGEVTIHTVDKSSEEVWKKIFNNARKKTMTRSFHLIFHEEVRKYGGMKQVEQLFFKKTVIDLNKEAVYLNSVGVKCPLHPVLTAELIQSLEAIVKELVPNKQYYTEGMVEKLKKEVVTTSENLAKRIGFDLLNSFNVAMHVFALRSLHAKMKERHEAWEKRHSLASILISQKRDLIALIKTRLLYGFTFAGEGKAIAYAIFRHIVEKAASETKDSHATTILSINWLQTSSTVRFEFFRQLVETIQVRIHPPPPFPLPISHFLVVIG